MVSLITESTGKLLNSLLIGYLLTLFLAPVFSYYFLFPSVESVHVRYGEIFADYVQLLIQSFIFSVPFFVFYAIIAVLIFPKFDNLKHFMLALGLLSLFLFMIMFTMAFGSGSLVGKTELRIGYIIWHFCYLLILFRTLNRKDSDNRKIQSGIQNEE